MASRRERYEAANIRGGLGVRKRLSDESFRTTYRLNGVQRGATIAECFDKYGRWEGGYRLGVLVRKTAHWVHVKWDDEEEIAMISQGDARYKVDRDKWRITNPRVGSPLNPTGAQSSRAIASANPSNTKESRKKGSGEQLTGHDKNGKIASSPQSRGTPPTEEMNDMNRGKSNAASEREAAQKAVAGGSLQERETYTAKQVATRCGTDAKTMRKFFRSSHSTVEAVGQGGRYEFKAEDLPQIKKEFKSWLDRSKSRGKPGAPKVQEPVKKQKKSTPPPAPTDIEEDDSPWEPHPDLADFDPTEEDLAEIDELTDLDLDDLDAEEV